MNEMIDSKKEIIEGTADILEYGIDFFTENELIKEFPIIGTVIKIGFTVKSISDRIFLKKIGRFLFHYNDIKKKEKINMISKMREDSSKKKVGEMLILLIDRFSDFDKPAYLAYCFIAYIEGQITLDDFIRLGTAIDLSYSPDLKNFIENSDERLTKEKLIRTGLTEISKNAITANTDDNVLVTVLYPRVSSLGEIFLNLFKK
jgi:hypothetical protein